VRERARDKRQDASDDIRESYPGAVARDNAGMNDVMPAASFIRALESAGYAEPM
jgi:hypothetical protein